MNSNSVCTFTVRKMYGKLREYTVVILNQSNFTEFSLPIFYQTVTEVLTRQGKLIRELFR
jgi:hypothetical protein